MKYSVLALMVFAFAAALCLVSASRTYCNEKPKVQSQFVDQDGDGIDDSRIDTNGDGIPDEKSEKTNSVEAKSSVDDNEGMFTAVLDVKSIYRQFLSNSAKHGLLKSSVRALCVCRGGIESTSGFGPGSGIGGGAVFGGHCEGGVCLPD